jgi:hypothetical protein
MSRCMTREAIAHDQAARTAAKSPAVLTALANLTAAAEEAGWDLVPGNREILNAARDAVAGAAGAA